MKRGDIYYANLSPVMGSEMGKRRPVLIVSNDISNSAATTVTILPLTSNLSRVYPFEVLLNPEISGLTKPSKVQAQQVRTISKQRITGEVLGSRTYATLILSLRPKPRIHFKLSSAWGIPCSYLRS